MRMILAAAAALTLTGLPAMAGSTTVEFASADGQTIVVVFNDDGTASSNGSAPSAYTMNEETKTVCGTTPDNGEICATFDELGEDVGFSTGYTNTAGQSGTATITAKD